MSLKISFLYLINPLLFPQYKGNHNALRIYKGVFT